MEASLSSTKVGHDNPHNFTELSKVHHVTVAMVPPPETAPHVWDTVSQMRRQMKDPGYYRWPPHANLLYPFLNVSPKSEDELLRTIVQQLHSATCQIEPFSIRLQQLDTFGGKQRGVLWLNPDSTSDHEDSASLLKLHQKLEEAFPMCRDQTKGGTFTPHMTITHYPNLDEALKGKETVEKDYQEALSGENLTFLLDRIYLLHRQGDHGQFLRLAEIGLGTNSKAEFVRPPRAFEEMPTEEEEWVYKERMEMKARRNRGGSRGGRRKQQRRRSREPRIPDTPEVIAAKRAERKAKRERLEKEQQQANQD